MTAVKASASAMLTIQASRSKRSRMPWPILASASRAGMGGDCVAVGNAMKRYVDSLIARAPSPERAQEAQRMMDDPPIEVVSMDGATATARVQGVSDETIPLVHTELGWRISGFTNLGG